eukprot:COSAG03_NODE_9807_length_692_cov_1.308600_1_plen_32_part_10
MVNICFNDGRLFSKEYHNNMEVMEAASHSTDP